jgi:hypothetical protein
MVKARFAAGRFVEGDGTTAVLAFPNAPHRDACEPMRAQVEDALAAHFGRPVPLRLVVDGGGAPAAAADPRPGTGGPVPAPDDEGVELPPDPGPEEYYDASELVDAPPETAVDPVARVAHAFPGALLVDDDGRG